MFSYNGYSPTDAILSKIAAFAALFVALFPCNCGDHDVTIPYLHYISAAIMFIILALFCRAFYKRARSKGHLQAKIRAHIYAVCGYAILLSVSILAVDNLFANPISFVFKRLTFYGEAVGLVSFGIAWLVASRMLPIITIKKERLSILS